MIPSRVKKQLKRCNAVRAEPLSGDASDRAYYRIWNARGDRYVLADYGKAFDASTLSYLAISKLLEACDASLIPRTHGIFARAGFLLVEDVGDQTLYQLLQANGHESARPLYYQAVDIAARLQREIEVPWLSVFGADRMLEELSFFFTNFIEKSRNCDIKGGLRNAFLDGATQLVDEIGRHPRAFSHRDFHSRNLILFERHIVLLDFQDAFQGPYLYDLVSLLLDPYADLPDDMVGDLVQHYFNQQSYQADKEQYFRDFCAVGIHRLLKAIGTYAYLGHSKQLSFYDPFIPIALRRVSALFDRVGAFDGLHRVLTPHLGGRE